MYFAPLIAPPPVRIQLKRIRGWRMPRNTVKVDRTTPWGNPYRVGDLGINDSIEAIARFERMLRRPGLAQDHIRFQLTAERIHTELRGKNLACWCKAGQPCHADVLLAIANHPNDQELTS